MESRKIIIKAYSEHTQQPIKISPCEDREAGGKLYTGQGKLGYYESLTKREREDLAYLITPATVIILRHGMRLNLDDPVDAANWKWMQRHPWISLERSNRLGKDVRFYVEDLQKEAEDRLVKSKPVTEARYLIEIKASPQQLINAARALGHPSPESFNISVIQDWLVNRASGNDGRDAKLVLKCLSPDGDGSVNARILASELKQYAIITKERGGVFKFGGPGGIFIGRNEDDVNAYLLSNENVENVAAMKSALKEAKENVTA